MSITARPAAWLPFLTFALTLVSAFAGCAHDSVADADRELARPAPMFPAAAATPAEAPSMLQLRVLTVAYHGAPRAPSDLQRSREDALTRARMLVSMARGGEKLSALVGEYSDRAGANDNRGVLRLSTAQPEPFDEGFVRSVLALPVGTVSEPIEQPEGFVIVERMDNPPTGPERVGAKHILIGYAGSPKSVPSVTRNEAEAKALAEKVAREVHAEGADWDALASQYTDEPAGKTTGGDLGRFGRGQMVPAFEKAAFALKVGEISDVIKSPFGFHVIRRYE
ncbi:MAG: peptidylprolyl isomerase [Polyangiales bacterium]